MEVVVTFDGGDPDRPLVIGSLYNGIHPPAFPLPEQKTRSGLRTQSSPNARGGFEDDLVTRVDGNHTVIVGKNDAKRSFTLRVEGTTTISSEDGLVFDCPGGITFACGTSSVRIGKDGIELVGDMVRTAGKSGSLDAGKDGVKVRTPDVTLHCGEKLLAKTKAASLSLHEEVKLDGKKILLNSPDQASDDPPPEPVPLTTIELTDQDGNPLGGQRFVIELDDGTKRTGVTGKDGRCSLDLPSNGELRTSDLPRIRNR